MTISSNNRKGLYIICSVIIFRILYPVITTTVKVPFYVNLVLAILVPIIFIYGLVTFFSKSHVVETSETGEVILNKNTNKRNLGTTLLIVSFLAFLSTLAIIFILKTTQGSLLDIPIALLGFFTGAITVLLFFPGLYLYIRNRKLS